jgi:hypothetical protein
MEDQKQQEQMSEDNLMKELDSFNEGSSPETAETKEVEAKESETQDGNAGKEAEEKPEPEIEQWLIENKFKNDEDGVKNLSEAYKSLQSKSDKDRNDFKSKEDQYTKLQQLDNFLVDNPDVAQKIVTEVQAKRENLNKPPVKPEDYDILDESIDNSSSAGWRANYDQWLISQGSAQAISEVNKLKAELAEAQAFDAETIGLQKMGLSDVDIVEYRQFMADPNNVSQENLVGVWKQLSQHTKSSPKQKLKNKQNSPASVTGSTPPAIQPDEKALDSFWAGIMEHSNET